MRNVIACLISIFLLSSLTAKAAMQSNTSYSSITKVLIWDQNEKIDIEDGDPTTYDQLKNDEFVNSYYHHPVSISSSNIQFKPINSIIPSSYLERPERPPRKDLFKI